MAVADQTPRIVGIVEIPPDGGVAVTLTHDEDLSTTTVLRAVIRALSRQRSDVGA